jgi:hypothetical protein
MGLRFSAPRPRGVWRACRRPRRRRACRRPRRRRVAPYHSRATRAPPGLRKHLLVIRTRCGLVMLNAASSCSPTPGDGRFASLCGQNAPVLWPCVWKHGARLAWRRAWSQTVALTVVRARRTISLGDSFVVQERAPVAYAGEVLEHPVTGERVRFLQTARDTGGHHLLLEVWSRPTTGGAASPRPDVLQQGRLNESTEHLQASNPHRPPARPPDRRRHRPAVARAGRHRPGTARRGVLLAGAASRASPGATAHRHGLERVATRYADRPLD